MHILVGTSFIEVEKKNLVFLIEKHDKTCVK